MKQLNLLFVSLLCFISCGENIPLNKDVSVESVSLDYNELIMNVRDQKVLTATIEPHDATNQNIIWNSSNESFASVINGKVTAAKVGKVIITATSEDSRISATCDVTIVDVKDGNNGLLDETIGEW